jgi:CMP-N-acetylneuraminic acid synthetase
MKTYALLTGRGNNTLPDKNVIDILGHPVLYYPANAAKQVEAFNDFYVSSDDYKILNAAEDLGYKKIVRPKELATPTSQHIECIIHALSEFNKIPDILVVLLANNVTIKKEWIKDCIEIMTKDMSISAVVPVYEENDHHPYRAKRLNVSGSLEMFVQTEGRISTNRQDLPICYFLAHNFWVLNVKTLLSGDGQQPWTFMGNNIKPYIINESIDIHNEDDLLKAIVWLNANKLN